MTEPISNAAVIIAATTSLTLFGVATGLHPELLLAGLAGGLWSLFYLPPMVWYQRICAASIGSLVSGWFTPAAAIGITSMSWWPAGVTHDIVQFPLAVTIGLLSHAVIGPSMLKFAKQKADEVAK